MAGTNPRTRKSKAKKPKAGDRIDPPTLCQGEGRPWEEKCTRLVRHHSGTDGICIFCHVDQQPYTRRAMRGHWRPAKGSTIKWTIKSTGTRKQESQELQGVVVYSGASFDDVTHVKTAAHWWVNDEEKDEFLKVLDQFPNTVKHRASSEGVIVKVRRFGKNKREIRPHYYCPRLYFCDQVEEEGEDNE